jgi:hypothetical protein
MALLYLSLRHFLTDAHPKDSPDVHVPLSHVISVAISNSVVDTHVLKKSHGGLELVQLSGSFQGDNEEGRSSTNDWVQAAMSAAYTGVWRTIRTAYHK